ncbi:MAG: T9SS type A sorting domain-containing protein [Bacteroidota bacterium]
MRSLLPALIPSIGAPLLVVLLAIPAQAQVLTSLYSVRSPNSQNDGFFGAVVEATGDLNGDGVPDFAVGAPDEQGGLGRAYLVSGADGRVLLTIPSRSNQPGRFFGRSVAVTRDANGDGVSDLLIGSNDPTAGFEVAGVVYLVSGVDASTIGQFASPNAQANGFFGFDVAAPGDLNGDGVEDYVVAASDEDLTANGTLREDIGALYAFSGTDGALLWTSTADLDQAFSYLSRVEAARDMTGDGVPDLIASAPFADVGGTADAGQAFVIDGSDGAVVHTLTSGNAQERGAFGISLAGIGDVTGDGVPDVAVGAPFEGVNGSVRDGTVSFFNGTTGARIGTYAEEERQAERLYGWHVENVGDYDGDGVDDVGISALRQFNRFEFLPPPLTAPFSGALFITSGATIGQDFATDLAEVYPSLPNFPTTFEWNYGRDFAALGDVNGDGLNEIAIGAPTQGANIGFVGVLDGARIQALTDQGAEAEAETVVGNDGTYAFDGTAVTLVLDLAGAADDPGESGRGTHGDGANVVVTRYRNAPLDTGGIPESAVAQYRWTIIPERDLVFVAEASEVRFQVEDIPTSSIVDPVGIVVYRRQFVGGGDFEPLATTFDADTGEIVATGFTRLGEFVFASDTNPLPTDETPSEAALAVTVYPNPTFASASVTIVVPERSGVHAAVYDLLGRRVATLHEGPLAAGTHPLTLDAARLPAGLYVVRVVTPGSTLTRRLTVVR